MKFRICLLICLITSFTAYAENEIYVELAGEVQLIPLYISPIEKGSASQNALREVLQFDLNHNGMTRVLSQKEIASKASLKGQESFDKAPVFSSLKSDDVLYLVKLKMEGSRLHTKVFLVNSHESKIIDGVELTGDAYKDRRTMHALSNVIHEILFGKKGIATSRILYTLKKKVERPNQAPIWVSEV